MRATTPRRGVCRDPRIAHLGAVRPGYGVEIGILIDTYDRRGLDAIAQVNLGVRIHRNRPTSELGPMSRQVVATLLDRCGVADSGVGLTQFIPDEQAGSGYVTRTSAVSLLDRPP